MTYDELQTLNGLMERESGLRPRELDFIEDLDKDYRDMELSERQSDWLIIIGERLL